MTTHQQRPDNQASYYPQQPVPQQPYYPQQPQGAGWNGQPPTYPPGFVPAPAPPQTRSNGLATAGFVVALIGWQ